MMPSYTPDVLDKWIFYLACGLPHGHALREPEAGGDADSKARLAPSPVDHVGLDTVDTSAQYRIRRDEAGSNHTPYYLLA
jgi:hypothetical protein